MQYSVVLSGRVAEPALAHTGVRYALMEKRCFFFYVHHRGFNEDGNDAGAAGDTPAGSWPPHLTSPLGWMPQRTTGMCGGSEVFTFSPGFVCFKQ